MPLLGSRGAASTTGFGALANLGYFLRNSLRFRASNSAYLSRTPASAGNRKTWTWSGWVKRGALGTRYNSFFTSSGSIFGFEYGADYNQFWINQSGVWSGHSEAVFRDVSAWYHIVLVYDTTQATDTNRVRLYVNGVQNTLVTDGGTLPTQNSDGPWNQAASHLIGLNTTSYYFDGYLAEVNFIDGQALTPSSFGKTDATTGQWVPKKFGGSYGTNGFYLPFTNTSSTSTLVADSSGNGNNWTPNNISLTAGATYDSMTDVPTLTNATTANYATLNPLSQAANLALIQGNLAVYNTNATDTHRIARATIGMTTGKWYWEVHVNNSANVDIVGVADDTTGNAGNNYLGGSGKSAGWGYNTTTGSWYQGPWTVNSPTPPAFPSSGIIGVAYDADAGKLWFSSNGTWLSADGGTGNPATGSNPNLTLAGTAGTAFYPAISIYYNGGTWAFNFGQRSFAYTPPSGFKALNTFNLP